MSFNTEGSSLTLIVARQFKSGQVGFIADTRIYDPQRSEREQGWERGTIKIALINPDALLAFSGSPDLANRALRSIPDRPQAHLQIRATIEHFKDASDSTGCEFLLSFLPHRKIFKVAAGQVTTPLAPWIGDAAAYGLYRTAETVGQRRPTIETVMFTEELVDVKAFGALVWSLRRVIDDEVPRR